MAVPTTLHGHACSAHPAASAGRGGGAGLSPCRGSGEEGGAGEGDTRIPLGGGGQAGGREGRGGGRKPRRGPMHVSRGWGVWLPPGAVSSGWGDVLHPCACHYWVDGLGLHLCARQHRAEGTVGVAPLQPTPAPLPTEGLWECCNSCTRAAALVPPLVHQAYCCSSGVAVYPRPGTTEGPWGCTSHTQAAAHARQRLLPVPRSRSGTASAP